MACGGGTSTSCRGCCGTTPTCACCSSSPPPTRSTRCGAGDGPGEVEGCAQAPPSPNVSNGRLLLFQPTKVLPRKLDRGADDRLATSVVRAARRAGFDDPVLWVNDPAAATLLGRTGWRALYDITDDWLHADHTAAEHERLLRDESLLLTRCAHVVVCSPALLESKTGQRGTAAISLVPNAVDLAAYAEGGERPTDLPEGRVALYVGTVHPDRVDLEVCVATARELAGRATLAVVGPVHLGSAERAELERAGVVLLGARDHRDVPRYLIHADVLLVPHVVSAFTDSLDPIKLYEYRAASRPVVSTPVAGFRDSDDPLVTVRPASAFAAAVMEAIETGASVTKASSRTLDVPSWDDRARAMASVVTDVVESRPGRQWPSVAIAHDYLTQRGGAERVVLAMHRAFPDATIYTTLYEPDTTYPEFRNARIVTSGLSRVAPLRRNHRASLPFLPFASRTLRIREDVVVTSTSGWAHGFAATGQRIVYCHAPARWLYQTEAYLGGGRFRSAGGWALTLLSPWLRRWDRRHAVTADLYFANSRVVRDRMMETYGIEAVVLPAPHAIDADADQAPVPSLVDWAEDGYYLVVSRLLPYKNVGTVIEAFRGLGERLVVVGSGPLRRTLERHLPHNVRLVSDLTDPELHWTYAHSLALVAPSLEDYGLTPLEAAAYGKPTLALGAGGYLDTVMPGVTGSFFLTATPAAIRATVLEQRHRVWSSTRIIAHAARFSEPVFHAALRAAVAELSLSGPPTTEDDSGPLSRRLPV